jgi:hypothetical protein
MSLKGDDGFPGSGTKPPPAIYFGVWGASTSFAGVIGTSDNGVGMQGVSNVGYGVIGTSGNGVGVSAEGYIGVNAQSTENGTIGVQGTSANGIGVRGLGGSNGVFGQTNGSASGVYGKNTNESTGATGIDVNPGVTGESAAGTGIFGISNLAGVQLIDTFTPGGIGVAGVNDQPYGIGVFGRAQNVNGIAGDFLGNVIVQGNVTVTGDVILTGADCAEEFDVVQAEETDPGTVMVLNQGGTLQPCQQAYDKKVAGVISGADRYKPGLILDRQQSRDNRLPVALVGKVYCKVDAQYGPIEVGDLLTTSHTPGHAMKANDPLKAFGSVIGKALHPLEVGQGMIPILIALQ